MSTNETFITCAVTGGTDSNLKNEHVPITPREIADSVIESAKAGAAIAHIHVRDPDTGRGSRDDNLYKEVVDRVREASEDIIINLTAGMGGDLILGADDPFKFEKDSDLIGPMDRLSHVEKLLPEICTLDCGSYNVGEGNLVYVSTSDYIRRGAARIKSLGVKPELEVFDVGHLAFVLNLVREGCFDGLTMVQLCLGVPFGSPATPAAMMLMQSMLPANEVVWSAFGVGRQQMPMVGQAVLLGGNVRVGLEDNIYIEKGVFATNGQLVERAANIVENLGSRILSPAETRKKLGIVKPIY